MDNALILSEDGNTIDNFSDKSATHVIIPQGITRIGRHSFKGCKALQSIDIPNSITSIEAFAFDGCTALQSVDIPNSVNKIGECSFRGCTSLQSIDIPNSVTSIAAFAFKGCIALQSVDIPNSVTEIERFTFKGCRSLKSVDIPSNVTKIGNFAFRDCTALGEVIIPNGMKEIGEFAFNNTGLRRVTIPSSVSIIGEHAFCAAPVSEYIVDDGNEQFRTIDGVLFGGKVKIKGQVWTAPYKTKLIKYPPQKEASKYIVDNGITSIGSCAFKGSERLEEIVLHDKIMSFGGEQTFARCYMLKNFYVPPKVSRLPDSCFTNCISLKHVYVLNENDCQIFGGAFSGCTSLEGLHFRIQNPENIIISDRAFDAETFEKCCLYIPAGTRWGYKHHPVLGRFQNIKIEK